MEFIEVNGKQVLRNSHGITIATYQYNPNQRKYLVRVYNPEIRSPQTGQTHTEAEARQWISARVGAMLN